MPRKFSFPSIKMYDDGLYEILQHRVEPLRDYIARFNQEKVAVPECSIPTAISTFKRGLLPDGGLYKELTMYPCKTMEDVLSRAWAQVKWEEDVASRAKAQPKQDQRSARSDRGDREGRSSQKGSKDSGSRNRGRTLVRFPSRSWPKTEDCIALRIEVNELLQKRHLREFLSEKAMAHLSKETAGKPKGAAPTSQPRQDRVIHVISGGLEVSGVSHAAAKKAVKWSYRAVVAQMFGLVLRLMFSRIAEDVVGKGSNHDTTMTLSC
ncbi:hypothetical protein F2Q70_00039297 [Brassica cretica]|uniref:Retrotransposon gag domain-containing protein n=1 Tax=Brassica cretica TaxID=69181 RepID=A0A8S9K7A7_BRACR|nr:hypothetical protein F2Q70_00039297 [Brassica cretica]